MTQFKIYVSGIRPTGSIHLGNYLGAIKPWLALQETGEYCKWFIADLHGQHTAQEVAETYAQLSGLGVAAFRESTCKAALLGLYHELSQKTPVGWLNRMTQFKDKTGAGEEATLSLFAYPVLMAADIFYFSGTHIPVGDDQVQHIEFARDLQARFPQYAKPEAVVMGYPRVMSLKDGTKKMSKSDPDDNSRINVTDDAATIRKKIRGAKTTTNISDITAESANLYGIYHALGGRSSFEQWGKFRDALADLIIKELKK
jgi:tryptophanyl-tRNA synthetase